MASFIARARKSFKKSSPKKKTTSLDFDDDEIFNNNLHKVGTAAVSKGADRALWRIFKKELRI